MAAAGPGGNSEGKALSSLTAETGLISIFLLSYCYLPPDAVVENMHHSGINEMKTGVSSQRTGRGGGVCPRDLENTMSITEGKSLSNL